MADETTKTYVYFMYSTLQLADRKAVSATMGRKFVPGTVVVSGKKKIYTELSKTGKPRYADAIIVAEGYQEDIQYTEVDPV